VANPDNTVFLSYRREVSWAMAHLVCNDLMEHGFDVFMDVQNLDSGEFERVILHEIEAREHFLVLVEPRSFDRIGEEGDWLRREIACALTHDRNVVPVFANGARPPRPADLPADVARLSSFNGVSVPHDYFPEAMQKLRERFLWTHRPDTTAARDPGREPSRGQQLVAEAQARTAPQLTVQLGPGATAATLSWTTPAGAAFYVLHAARTPDFDYVHPFNVDTTSRAPVLKMERTKQTWWYRVRVAGPDARAGSWSNAVCVPPRS
jgi:TIR domain